MNKNYNINPDIKKAETLPANFYKNENTFEALKDHVFLKSWQFIGDESLLNQNQSVYPFTLLEDFLSEPLLLTKDKSQKINCLSNVCTHRGNLVVLKSGNQKKLTCGYHGRRFNLKGKFEFMPEFNDAIDFPKPCDNLHEFPLLKWGSLLFVGLNPLFNFQQVIDKMNERIGFLPFDDFVLSDAFNKDYTVDAHWALYCDNYLEGFHVPFVHNDLDSVLDYGSYKTEIYQYCNLQIGYSDESKNTFNLPKNHIDYGKNVAAYYYWVFPNMMFNFYPWGLSLNIVQPLALNKTKVSFISYVFDTAKLDLGAGSGLDKVEKEDEEIVENVQKGIRSSFYKSGRFSPTREKGVHHFHGLLADFLNR
ncbi:MAG: Rieske 2Fe-2S domain-containing protein [Flaviramulus sp.]|nr:SRPBCC family protein [Flaviramulus sp.]NNC49086.1 Rieske 2Fe-2S domain-containing protein [Flaviramulus sp.]